MLHFITNIIVLLPLIFSAPAQYEASNIEVYEDGSFSLYADQQFYTGCLPNADCTDGGTQADNVIMFEDGSGIWHFSTKIEISGCFKPDLGCE